MYISVSCPQLCIVMYYNAKEAGRMEEESQKMISRFLEGSCFMLTDQELLSMKGSLIDRRNLNFDVNS